MVPSSSPAKRITRVLPGGYVLSREIGRGCFAAVYEGRSPDGRRVAVKVPEGGHPQAVKRFRREVKVMRQVPPSDRVVRYIDDGELADGTPFLVLDYISGVTLGAILDSGQRVTAPAACALMMQLCDAFAGLHKLGMTHGDIKPDNIMLSRQHTAGARSERSSGAVDMIWLSEVELSDIRMTLLDFGLVRDAQGLMGFFEEERFVTGDEFAEDLDTGMLAGTPEYISPEQISDARLADPTASRTDTPSDVFGLGVIFYTLIAGRPPWPFRPTARTAASYRQETAAYLDARLYATPERLPNTSPALWSIIARALDPDPKKRQGTAMDLQRDIARYLRYGAGIPETLDQGETMTVCLADLDPDAGEDLVLALDLDFRKGAAIETAAPEPPPGPEPPAAPAGFSVKEKLAWAALLALGYSLFLFEVF